MAGGHQCLLKPGPSLAGAARPRGTRLEGGWGHPELHQPHPLDAQGGSEGRAPQTPGPQCRLQLAESGVTLVSLPPSQRTLRPVCCSAQCPSCPLKTVSDEVCLRPVQGAGHYIHTRAVSLSPWTVSLRAQEAASGLPCPAEGGFPGGEAGIWLLVLEPEAAILEGVGRCSDVSAVGSYSLDPPVRQAPEVPFLLPPTCHTHPQGCSAPT